MGQERSNFPLISYSFSIDVLLQFSGTMNIYNCMKLNKKKWLSYQESNRAGSSFFWHSAASETESIASDRMLSLREYPSAQSEIAPIDTDDSTNNGLSDLVCV